MGLDHPDVAAAAMSVACHYVRTYPKLVHWMTTSDDAQAEPILERLRDNGAVKRWLHHDVAFRRWQEELAELIDAADTFVNHSGQAGRLMETYRQQKDSGQLDQLSTSARAVHRAVFSLGVYDGAPVLGALRYIQTAVRAQSGGSVQLSPTAVGKHLRSLTRRGLFLHYDPGQRGARVTAGRVHLELTPVTGEPDTDLVLDLSLSQEHRLALVEYVGESRERRAEARGRLQQEKARLERVLMKPHLATIMDGILSTTEEWTEVLMITGERVYVPGRGNGYVYTTYGSHLDEKLALNLRHVDSCESPYLPPMACGCVEPEIELAEEW